MMVYLLGAIPSAFRVSSITNTRSPAVSGFSGT